MNLRSVKIDEFSVIGIEIRTNNSEQMSPDAPIGKLWGKFFQENLLAKIPNRSDQSILAVYSNYETDYHGNFDYLIGAKVEEGSTIPPGMILKRVPAAKYTVVTSSQGPVQEVVPAAWKHIWTLDDTSQLAGQRAYLVDFELYDERSRNPQSAQVDIFIGVK